MRTTGMTDELLGLKTRKAQLASETKLIPAPVPRLRPRLADIYRDKVENLHNGLNAESTRADASQALARADTDADVDEHLRHSSKIGRYRRANHQNWRIVIVAPTDRG